MADDLATYKLQLEQVEAALTSDPGNEDLIKLKSDLEEVIALTEELVSGQTRSAGRRYAEGSDEEETHGDNDDDEEMPGSTAYGNMDDETRAWLLSDWKAGDRCRAIWSQDQQYYPATIDEILDDGTCSVVFDKYNSTEVTKVASLRSLDETDSNQAGSSAANKPKTKKDLYRAQQEYKKKKAQKKAQRQKQMEDDREQDKNKWKQFNEKVFSKTSKGKVKKSIFATTEFSTGRVGIGTCGVSGRPMTKFTYQEKYKK